MVYRVHVAAATAALVVSLPPLSRADGADLPDGSLRQPLIDESLDTPGCLKGFPDPFPFRWGEDIYIFPSFVDLRAPRFYRTRTLAPGDLTPYTASFDFGETTGVVQIWGFKPYVHTDGTFHAYGSLHYGRYQTETAHFVPQEGEEWTAEGPILRWRLNRVLLGEAELGARIAYDGFVLRDEQDVPYLIVNETIERRNCITARRMLDPATVDPTFKRRILLAPEDYASEDLPWDLRIVEGTFIEKIQGKYVLVYSVGFYSNASYKVGVAYSDTLIPRPGDRYQKALFADGSEVQYLLQTHRPGQPNYVGDFVNGPGIGSIVILGDRYYLLFAARRPGHETPSGEGRYAWLVPLRIEIDEARPMHTWIEPILPALDGTRGR